MSGSIISARADSDIASESEYTSQSPVHIGSVTLRPVKQIRSNETVVILYTRYKMEIYGET